jgi:predicted nucleic acid-binding protein
VIVCPNTSPLLVLARLDRLDLLGDPASIVLTQAVLDEIHDKQDAATARVDALARGIAPPVDPVPSDRVDLSRSLGPGERSVLTWAVSAGPEALSVLDDAAARTEARRLGVAVTGTLGLVLRAKLDGRLAAAAPLLEEAVAAGLYLDDAVLAAALAAVGEAWPRR